jgi:hypothetical protein
MTSLLCGVLQFERRSIPPELADLKTWPSVDERALKGDHGATYLKRAEAVQLFVREPGVTLKEITDRTGVDRKSIVRLFKRCVKRHPDGRIAGFRALVPFNRQKSYTRTATVTANAAASNSTGAFAQLLDLYPPLEDWLDRAARNRRQKTNGQREVRQDLRRIHKSFLAKCRELGLTAAQYPFNRERLGVRSLAAHLKRRTNASFEAAAADAGARHIRRAWPADVEQSKEPITGRSKPSNSTATRSMFASLSRSSTPLDSNSYTNWAGSGFWSSSTSPPAPRSATRSPSARNTPPRTSSRPFKARSPRIDRANSVFRA